MIIYMMRHGQTDWNIDHRLQGSADIPLNTAGRQMARTAAEGLKRVKLDRIFSSPLKRAAETAETVAALQGLTVEYREGLREMNFGVYEGHNGREWPELRAIFDSPETFVPRGGESFEQLIDRCRTVLEEICTLEGECENVLLVGHGAVLKAMVFIVDGKTDLREFWNSPPQTNCSVTVTECRDGTVRVLEYAGGVDKY